jgi:hypothetical protein
MKGKEPEAKSKVPLKQKEDLNNLQKVQTPA